MTRTGRPPKPDDEKSDSRTLRWPRELWERLCRLVPERKRSAFVHEAVRKELDRVEREQR